MTSEISGGYICESRPATKADSNIELLIKSDGYEWNAGFVSLKVLITLYQGNKKGFKGDLNPLKNYEGLHLLLAQNLLFNKFVKNLHQKK